MYKSKLQELCFKNSWALPQYSAIKIGPDHIPEFRASVFVNGKFFHSLTSCGSLKKAQNQAAKTALTHVASPDSSNVSAKGCNFGNPESFGKPCEAETSHAKLAEKINAGKFTDAAASIKSKGKSTREIASDAQVDTLASLDKEEMVTANKQKPPEPRSFLLSNKVRVYSYIPNITNLPKGVTVMPIDEDNWVAVGLDFPSEKQHDAA